MKHTLLGSLIGLALVACSNSSKTGFVVRAQLPGPLEKNTARFNRFVERVQHLKIQARPPAGATRDYLFPAERWDQIQLAELELPREKGETLELVAQVWDRTREGLPRSYPVLIGKTVLRGGDFQNGEKAEIVLKLSLQISSNEYDRP